MLESVDVQKKTVAQIFLPHAWQKYLATFKLMSQVVQRALLP